MDELTAVLRQARLEKQLSLRDISEITKIQPRYLEALENGDFSVFAGEVYLKGALKNFAATVGLDPAEVMALYNKLRSQEPEVEEVEQPVGEKVKTAAKPRLQKVEVTRQGPSFTAGVIVLLLFLVVGLGFIGFLDDYIKISRQRSLGLNPLGKMIGQAAVGITFAVLVTQFPNEFTRRPASLEISVVRDTGISSWLATSKELKYITIPSQLLEVTGRPVSAYFTSEFLFSSSERCATRCLMRPLRQNASSMRSQPVSTFSMMRVITTGRLHNSVHCISPLNSWNDRTPSSISTR